MARCLLLAACCAVLVPGLAAQVRLVARVLNENNAPVAGATVVLLKKGVAQDRLRAATDPAGIARFELQQAGEYAVEVEQEGYFRLTKDPLWLQPGDSEIQLLLTPLREVFESIDVTASAPTIEIDSTASEKALRGPDITAIPYQTTNNLKNVLRSMPGVIQDRRSSIHVEGSREDQVMYTLDGFNVSDPLTGRFEARLSVEAVQEINLQSSRLAAEYGKGSAGILAIRTSPGDDRFRRYATNFVPGLESTKGLHFGNWTPRAGISGPIRRGRAWFSDSVSVQYVNSIVKELPKGDDRTASWRYSNLLYTQVNLTPSNILYSGFLINYWNAPQSGLDFMNPRESTVDRRARQWFAHLKDQIYFARGAVLEVGAAINRTFGREIPQGHGILLLTPEGRRGYHYIDATRHGGRDQFLANLLPPSFDLAGRHQLKAGLDLNRVTYSQDVKRTQYAFLRLDGTTRACVQFGGSGVLSRTNQEAGAYLQDSWRIRPNLLVEAGFRADWNRIVPDWTASPRLGFAWRPPPLENTKISGGFTLVYDAAHLRTFTRPLDQYSINTYYDAQGNVARGPALSVFESTPWDLRMPWYRKWSFTLEQKLPWGLQARLEGVRKRGRQGFTYLNLLGPGDPAPPEQAAKYKTEVFDAIYRLGNLRRDIFDSFELTLRQSLRNQHGWMASYTRSRALSNSVFDLEVDDPYLITSNVGRMPWDSPNRVVSWGYLPTPWKNWSVAFLMELRDGFPFSIIAEDGRIEQVNTHRYPYFFELNLHLERRFTLLGHRWAVRAGFNNITNHDNPNLVNNNVDSPHFMYFYGGQGRSSNVRIRWLGRQ